MLRREFSKLTAAGFIGLGLPASILARPVVSLDFESDSAKEGLSPGDRNLRINQIYPQDAFYHNGNGGRVLDVTKPPFNARGDGVTDDTKALEDAMRFVRENYEFLTGKCTRKRNRNWIIYLPEGEYLVSDTVSQGWPAQAFNTPDGNWSNVNRFTVASPEDDRGYPDIRNEENFGIRIIGQSRENTIIRLKDSCSGFAEGSEKAVLTYYLLQRGSNTNLGNYLQNITINTGKGNPGAVGLKWNASNYGGIQNVAILSGDGSGHTGLMMDRRNAHGYHHDLVIDGFDMGILLVAGVCTLVVLEYATLSHQREIAIQVGRGARDSLSARKLLVKGAPVALKVGKAGHVVILDSIMQSSTEKPRAFSVEEGGHLFARDISLSGYTVAINRYGKNVFKGDFIEEYVSDTPVSIHADVPVRSLHLPVRDAPLILPEQDLSKWASVDEYGAVGDGVTDDTIAIQRAMNSGKPVIYFPKANYVVNGTVDIPATVREVSWLFGGVHRSKAVEWDGPALFRVAEPSPEPLLIHKSVTAGGVFLDHEADRKLVLEDIEVYFHHARSYAAGKNMLFPSPAAQNTDTWRLYRNTRPEGKPKEVFASNVLFFAAPGTGSQHNIENVHAWVRQLNNEHLPWAQIAFRRSKAWIFGFKSEYGRVLFHVEDSTSIEVLGGIYGQQHRGNIESWYKRHLEAPLIIANNSHIAMVFCMFPFGIGGDSPPYITILHDETNGRVNRLPYTQFPLIGGDRKHEILVPLLVD